MRYNEWGRKLAISIVERGLEMAFQVKPYPDFSWSQSRDATFQDCMKKYFFHYYASHNGWLDSSTSAQKQAYALKQLSNLHVILGSAIHEIAYEVMMALADKQSQVADVNNYIQQVRNRLNEAYLQSKEVARWMRAPKKSMMLHEMYYGGQLPPDTVKIIKDKIEPCVRNIFTSETFAELKDQKDIVVLEAEQMKTTTFEQDQMYAIPDLLYKRADGTHVIVDWKTGKEYEQNEEQTLLYAMYTSANYQVDIERVEIRLEYLLSGKAKTIRPNAQSMERTKQWVRESLEQMKRLLENEEMNKPLTESFFTASPSTFTCRSCNFREICPDQQ